MRESINRYAEYSGFGKKRILYDNGLPFSNPLDSNLADLVRRINHRKASLLIIDGGIGEGKTTLGIHLGEHVQKKNINFKHQLAMGGDQFQEKLKICYELKLHVCIYDEAGDFDKRGAITRFNMVLNRVFDTYRTYGILVIMILPNFNVLDNSLFDKKIPRMLLHCKNRNDYYGNYSAYSLYRMYYLKKKMKEFTVKPQAYGATEPNFRGHFLDLIPERSIELDKFSTAGKTNILSENILKAKNLMNYKQLSRTLSKSDRWVQKKIKELKLTPETQYRRANYFASDVLELLREQVRY